MKTTEAYQNALNAVAAEHNPSDMDLIDYVNGSSVRAANFQGLEGRERDAYLAGCNQGVGRAMERMRELRILTGRLETVQGQKTMVYRFR